MQIKLFLFFLALSIVIPIGVNDAFGIDATVTLEKSLTVDASPREAAPRGLIFNDDGTKMYFVGGTRDKIYEYHLSTPFDINTAVNSNSHKSTSDVDTQPRSIAFQDNGKRMILAGTQTYKIWQYKLQDGGAWTPFDVSTASRDGTNGFDPSPEINDWGITWSADGTKMFVTGSADGTKVYQYGFNEGFLVGHYDGNDPVEFDLEFDTTAREIKFNPDGTKMFVIDSGTIPREIAMVHEFELSTGFDISTASKIISQTGTTSSFSVLNEEVLARGLAFSNDGTRMFISGVTGLEYDVNPDIHQYILSCPWQLTGTCEEEDTSKNKCYDCEAPRLVQVQVGITSNKNASDDSMTHVMKEEYVWNFPINNPLSMRDNDITKITANPGDEIEITLNVIDDKSVHLLPTSGIYTNFMERPNDMNLFFVNNFDENHNTSTSFYEWNRNHDDVAYDYADTVTWRNPDISHTQFPVTTQTPFELLNDELVIEHFIISFKMKFTDSMRPSQVWVSAADYYGQTFKISLPLTLEILGDEPIDFTLNLNQEVLGYFSEPVLLSMLYQWSETSEDVSELSSILGVNGELPQWTANLATWAVEEKITPAEMIIAIEYVINNS